MYFDNENAGTSANETTGITISRDDPLDQRPKKPNALGNVSTNWSKVYAKVLTVSGVNVITGAIADIKPDIEAIKANTDKDLSYISGNIIKRI